jgi:hypothetical protein
MTVFLYVIAGLLAGLLIFAAWGAWIVWDIHRINHREDWE